MTAAYPHSLSLLWQTSSLNDEAIEPFLSAGDTKLCHPVEALPMRLPLLTASIAFCLSISSRALSLFALTSEQLSISRQVIVTSLSLFLYFFSKLSITLQRYLSFEIPSIAFHPSSDAIKERIFSGRLLTFWATRKPYSASSSIFRFSAEFSPLSAATTTSLMEYFFLRLSMDVFIVLNSEVQPEQIS